MLSIQQSCFLRAKITQMSTAIMHSPDGAFFNLHSVMVRILEMDEEGNLWLAVNKPKIDEVIVPEHFDVLLNYYVKGVSFDLDMLGEASICIEERIITLLAANAQNEFRNGNLLLKVRIIDIDYWEQTIPVIKRIAQKLMHKFSGSSESHNAINLPVDQRFA